VRRVCFASIREHPPPGLAWLGQPFAIGRLAMLLQRSRACLQQALAAMFCLRVFIESIWEETRSKRYRYAVLHLVSCRRLGGAIGIWGAIPNHNSYINELLQAYGHRISLMKELDCDTRFATETPVDQLEADWRP
jgi:hypothetical protein